MLVSRFRCSLHIAARLATGEPERVGAASAVSVSVIRPQKELDYELNIVQEGQ